MLINEHLVKDEIALDFLLEVCVTFKQEKGLSSLVQALKKGNIESKLMEFFPAKKQTEEQLRATFVERDLAEVVKLHKAQASYEAKRELQQVGGVYDFIVIYVCVEMHWKENGDRLFLFDYRFYSTTPIC